MHGSFRKFLFFSAALLLGVATLLYVSHSNRISDLQHLQKVTAEYAVSRAVALIEQEIKLLQRSVQLFYFSYRPQLKQLIAEPENDDLRMEIQTDLENHFPDAVTFTFTDQDGRPLLVDFDNFIGELCQENLSEFSASGEVLMRIHPADDTYHFDIMTSFSDTDNQGVFFISFDAMKLARHLAAQPEHQLMLIYIKNDGLIELTSQGSRNMLQRDFFLSEVEKSSILVSQNIPGTDWKLVDIVSGAPGLNEQHKIRTHSLFTLLGFILASLAALLVVYFDERKLGRVIHALDHHKSKLEERIKLRTWELSEANRELHELSRQDSLTGVANRRFFDHRIDLEVRRMRREGQPLSLLMIDVDSFKRYNDSLGHPAGDECLKKIAQVISSNAHRGGDFVARYGGEEFAVILPAMDDAESVQFAESIRLAVLSGQFKHPDSSISPYVTVSIGVATLEPDSMSGVIELIESADKSLYAAKKAGRNRVELNPVFV
jgi:diguanylate cyclase (GGDEF)-like protein